MTNRNYFKITLYVHLASNSIKTEISGIDYNGIDSPPYSFICYLLKFRYLEVFYKLQKGTDVSVLVTSRLSIYPYAHNSASAQLKYCFS